MNELPLDGRRKERAALPQRLCFRNGSGIFIFPAPPRTKESEPMMQSPPPLIVERFTVEVAAEIRAVATTLPYRTDIGVDSERVFWVVEAGGSRTGIAYAAESDRGPYWMIAFSDPTGKRVSKQRIQEIVALVAGAKASWEVAPVFDGAPQMTMVRVYVI
jgi:hypothetical protein